MKKRCYNPHDKYYKNYGGRNIKVCDEWRSDFSLFKKWADTNGYKQGLSIDRIDNDKNYEPGNCRWVTPQGTMLQQIKQYESYAQWCSLYLVWP